MQHANNSFPTSEHLIRLRENVKMGLSEREQWGSFIAQITSKELPTPSEAVSTKMEEANLVKFGRNHLDTMILPVHIDYIRAQRKEYDTAFNHDTGKIEKGEDKRVDAVLPFLKKMLEVPPHIVTAASKHGLFRDGKSDVLAGRMDCFTYLTGLGLPLLIEEFKNRETSSCQSKAVTYFLEWAKYKSSVVVSNWPCVIISSKGTVLTVSAIVLGDCHSPQNTAVETTLYTLDLASDCAQTVANLFTALKECVIGIARSAIEACELARDGGAVVDRNVELRRLLQFNFPCFHEVFVGEGEEVLKFRYMHCLMNGKRVFRAKVTEDSPFQPTNKNLVIKFLKGRYGFEAHRLLAQEGMAPQLHGYLNLGFNSWKMVVMEDVDFPPDDAADSGQYTVLTEQDQLREFNCQDKEKVVMDCLHQANQVHGDMRFCNLKYVAIGDMFGDLAALKIKVYLLDFDWAGEMGKAKYPPDLNTADIIWPAGVAPGGIIMKEHDLVWHNERYPVTAVADVEEQMASLDL